MEVQTKQCTVCGERKSITEFYKKVNGKSGVKGVKAECKVCHRGFRWVGVSLAGQTKVCTTCGISKLIGEFYKRGAGTYGVCSQCKPCANKVATRWKKDHPEQVRVSNATYNKNHKEEKLICCRNRQAMILGAPGNGWTIKQRKRLLKLYDYRCAYCGEQTKLVIDHIVPLTKGGVHDIGNAAPACVSCNCSKHNKSLLEWLCL